MSNPEAPKDLGSKEKAREAGLRLFSARLALHPIRNNFILSNFFFCFLDLTSEQKLFLLNNHFSNHFEDQLATVKKDIGPPKKMRKDKLTNLAVEQDVLKNAGDFSITLFTKFLGEPATEEQKEFYRQFGEETVKPHIVFTKVVQRNEFRVKGPYGKNDNRGHIQIFTRLFEKRLVEERLEKSLQSNTNTIK